jgi:hypothetical protein
MAISNIAIDSLPTLQISLGIVALLEKIYDGEPILTVLQGSLNSFRTLEGWTCIDLFLNVNIAIASRDTYRMLHFQPTSFLTGQYL